MTGLRGPGQKDECANGHDLTKEENVRLVRRKRKKRTYTERQCIPCHRERARKWWRENRSKDAWAES